MTPVPWRLSVSEVSSAQLDEVTLNYKQTRRDHSAKFILQQLQIVQRKHWPLPTQNNFHSMLWSWDADVASLPVVGI